MALFARLIEMQAWVTLIATLAGAAVALFGQYVVRRGEIRTRHGELVLEQCAQVVALAHDYTNRIWEERQLFLKGRVQGWDFRANQQAVARLSILCADPALMRTLDDLRGCYVSF